MTTRRNNMNKLVKKPAKSPFDEAVVYGYTWTGEFKKLIEEQVKIHQELLTREAEFEGNSLLADENFLYQKFTENVANEEWNANWEILKFFGMNLKIKMLKYMYGEWCLTEHDKEMFDYFYNLEVNANTKCKPAKLKFKSGIEPKLDDIFLSSWDIRDKYALEYFMEYETYSNKVKYTIWTDYCDWFHDLENMYRNCKMLQKFEHVKEHVFEPEFTKVFIRNKTDSSVILKKWRLLKFGESVLTSDDIHGFNRTNYRDFLENLNEFMKKDPEYAKLAQQITEVSKKLAAKYIVDNKETYDSLSEFDKSNFQKYFV